MELTNSLLSLLALIPVIFTCTYSLITSENIFIKQNTIKVQTSYKKEQLYLFQIKITQRVNILLLNIRLILQRDIR